MATRKSLTRQAIVTLLKQHGGLTAFKIAREIGITPVAVRKHLESLETEGVVTIQRSPVPRGRPALVYHLTETANSYFPTAYDRLAVGLLEGLVELDGSEKLSRLFMALNERLIDTYEGRMADKDLSDQIQELARLRDEEGYMAVLEERDGSFVLRELHCPIYEVAHRHPEACNCEAELFKRILKRDVRRETSLVDGGDSCTYRISA